MEIEVRCFAAAREAAGTREFILDVPRGVTVGEFREILFATHHGLRNLSLQFALNMVYVGHSRSGAELASPDGAAAVTFDTELRPGDVIACIPPVGGG
ncbi:MAG: MoaD/ThiS family protein [Anaerolineae bacterium]|nr:MoaD/ThiS family protein [Anaerolineae bacterium]